MFVFWYHLLETRYYCLSILKESIPSCLFLMTIQAADIIIMLWSQCRMESLALACTHHKAGGSYFLVLIPQRFSCYPTLVVTWNLFTPLLPCFLFRTFPCCLRKTRHSSWKEGWPSVVVKGRVWAWPGNSCHSCTPVSTPYSPHVYICTYIFY